MTDHVKKEYCVCDGAGTCTGCTLFTCAVCGGVERSLPTECPGREMSLGEDEGVYFGKLDYVGGEWRRG